jgi:hypothetical protein
MLRHSPRTDPVGALRDAGDVPGMLELYRSTKRRDVQARLRAAVASLGDTGRDALLGLLGDDDLQRSAGGMLVELGEDHFGLVEALLSADDNVCRRGAWHTVYLYARYRELPAAHALLVRAEAGEFGEDLAPAAAAMREKVAEVLDLRHAEIDRQLDRIKASLQREMADGGSTVSKIFSTVHHARMEARLTITGMRWAAVRHLIAVSPDYGEAAIGSLLSLAMQELHGGIVPIIEEYLDETDRRLRRRMLTTLVCMRRAKVEGAAEALERDGAEITDKLDRTAARIYTRWVRE